MHVNKVNSLAQSGDSFCKSAGKDTHPQFAFRLQLDFNVDYLAHFSAVLKGLWSRIFT